ncbi:MAG: hypothetical protein FJZ90_16875, partial [Chloroflexi bacterium]|nr:hypothetical protein [Chloroflexota bacterium]
MERRRLIVSVCVVALVALAVAPTLTGCVPLTPEQAAMYGAAPVGSSIRKVTGRLTGVMEEEMMWLDDDCNPAEGEFEYLYNIYEVGPDGAAAGSAHARLRSLNPP